jgi:hypothetical protein
MILEASEFIRRFLLHVLPSGLQRIRYYSFLGNRHREEKLEQCRRLLHMDPLTSEETDTVTPADYRDRYEVAPVLHLGPGDCCFVLAQDSRQPHGCAERWAVESLARIVGWSTTFEEITPRMRCLRCGAKAADVVAVPVP